MSPKNQHREINDFLLERLFKYLKFNRKAKMSDPFDSDPVANNQDPMNLNQSMNSQTNPMGDSMNMGNSNFSFQ